MCISLCGGGYRPRIFLGLLCCHVALSSDTTSSEGLCVVTPCHLVLTPPLGGCSPSHSSVPGVLSACPDRLSTLPLCISLMTVPSLPGSCGSMRSRDLLVAGWLDKQKGHSQGPCRASEPGQGLCGWECPRRQARCSGQGSAAPPSEGGCDSHGPWTQWPCRSRHVQPHVRPRPHLPVFPVEAKMVFMYRVRF